MHKRRTVRSQSMDELGTEGAVDCPEPSNATATAAGSQSMSPTDVTNTHKGIPYHKCDILPGVSDTWVTCVNRILSQTPLPPVPNFAQFAKSTGLRDSGVMLTTRLEACDDVRYDSNATSSVQTTELELRNVPHKSHSVTHISKQITHKKVGSAKESAHVVNESVFTFQAARAVNSDTAVEEGNLNKQLNQAQTFGAEQTINAVSKLDTCAREDTNIKGDHITHTSTRVSASASLVISHRACSSEGHTAATVLSGKDLSIHHSTATEQQIAATTGAQPRYKYYRNRDQRMQSNSTNRAGHTVPKFGQPAFPQRDELHCTRTQSLPVEMPCGAEAQAKGANTTHKHRSRGLDKQIDMQRPRKANGQAKGRPVLSSRANKFRSKSDRQCVPVDKIQPVAKEKQKRSSGHTTAQTQCTKHVKAVSCSQALRKNHAQGSNSEIHLVTVKRSNATRHRRTTAQVHDAANNQITSTVQDVRVTSPAAEIISDASTTVDSVNDKAATTPPHKPPRPTVRFAPTPDKAYKKSRIPAFTTPEKVRTYRSTPSKQNENRPPPIKTPGITSTDKNIALGSTPKKCATFDGTCVQLELSPANNPQKSKTTKNITKAQIKANRRTPLAERNNLPSITCTYSQTSKYIEAMGSCHPGRHGNIIVSNVRDVEMVTKTVRKRPKAGDNRLSLESTGDDDQPSTTPTFRGKAKCLSRVRELKA